MPRRFAPGLALIFALSTLAAAPASAVVQGSSSSLGQYTVRLVGNGNCSGVAIGRRLVATAAHCAYGMRVLEGGAALRVVGVTRSAVLDDGRRVSVSGDAAILRLSADLAGVSAAPIGDGGGDTFTIAGYGTTDERSRGAFGEIHEASLVAASGRALVDPRRSGAIGASACFGDSGGPVMRGGQLVGVITRAAHPSPRLACGYLTRWAAVMASGSAHAPAAAAAAAGEEVSSHPKRQRHARKKQGTETASLFGWFSEKPAPKRKTARHKAAQR